MSLKGSKTEDNLKEAFAGESQANRRYLYFAAKADVEGYNDVAAVFRSTAEGETGHAHGHLEYLEETGDPATGMPIGTTSENLAAAIAGETHEYTDMYPGMAKTARDEDFEEIAKVWDTRVKEDPSLVNKMKRAPDPAEFAYRFAKRHQKSLSNNSELEKARARIAELEAQVSGEPPPKQRLSVNQIGKGAKKGAAKEMAGDSPLDILGR